MKQTKEKMTSLFKLILNNSFNKNTKTILSLNAKEKHERQPKGQQL